MICISSFIIFSFLGIFSAKYRALAFEAYNCMLDRLTRGECDADFEDKIKATVIGKALDYSPRTARFLEKHFQALSFLFVLVFIASFLWMAKSIVFLLAFGSCNGPDQGCALVNKVLTLI